MGVETAIIQCSPIVGVSAQTYHRNVLNNSLLNNSPSDFRTISVICRGGDDPTVGSEPLALPSSMRRLLDFGMTRNALAQWIDSSEGNSAS